jgi:hypothetical protein
MTGNASQYFVSTVLFGGSVVVVVVDMLVVVLVVVTEFATEYRTELVILSSAFSK